jgi:hypothetical protein
MLIPARAIYKDKRLLYKIGDMKAPGLNGGRAMITQILVEFRDGAIYYEVYCAENHVQLLWRNGLESPAIEVEYDVREGREL